MKRIPSLCTPPIIQVDKVLPLESQPEGLFLNCSSRPPGNPGGEGEHTPRLHIIPEPASQGECEGLIVCQRDHCAEISRVLKIDPGPRLHDCVAEDPPSEAEYRRRPCQVGGAHVAGVAGLGGELPLGKGSVVRKWRGHPVHLVFVPCRDEFQAVDLLTNFFFKLDHKFVNLDKNIKFKTKCLRILGSLELARHHCCKGPPENLQRVPARLLKIAMEIKLIMFLSLSKSF